MPCWILFSTFGCQEEGRVAATFVRRLLSHAQFKTKAKRMGTVIKVSHAGLSLWRLHAEKEVRMTWPK